MAFRHISECLPKGVTDMLKLHIGPKTNDVRVTLGDEDVTQRLRIAGLTVGPLGPNEMTQATLTVYCEAEVELLPEGVTVNVLDPHSPAADTACKNCGKPATIIAGVCSVECMEQIGESGTPVEDEPDPRDKLYTGPVRKP